MKKNMLWLVLAVVALLGVPQRCPAADPNSGLTAWALIGTNPEFAKSQEVRIGYEGLLPKIEVAVGVLHLDAPDDGVEDWSGRAYVIAHTLDAKMVASLLGQDIKLPEGNLYGGLFGQYTYDREDAVSGGFLLGGLVAWPGKWETVGEYSQNIWNNERDAYSFVVGLRRKF